MAWIIFEITVKFKKKSHSDTLDIIICLWGAAHFNLWLTCFLPLQLDLIQFLKCHYTTTTPPPKKSLSSGFYKYVNKKRDLLQAQRWEFPTERKPVSHLTQNWMTNFVVVTHSGFISVGAKILRAIWLLKVAAKQRLHIHQRLV